MSAPPSGTNANTNDEEVDEIQVIRDLYILLAREFKWTVREIDETNFESLIDFIFYKKQPDERTSYATAHERKLSEKPPDWL